MRLNKKDVKIIFQENLRYYRIQNKLTQEDLAEKAGLTPKYISDLERGKFLPSFEKLEDLAIAFDIDAYKLLKDENDITDIPNRLDKATGTRKKRI